MNQSPTILLIEDEAITGMAQAKTLETEGYNVIHVLSGENAIELFRKGSDHAIDLILMDIDLGRGMDGTVTAREILKSHDIPVVFLSSHTEKEIVEKTEKITSYGYVVKNTGITVLTASIKMAFKLHEAHRNIAGHKMEIEAAYEELQATNEQLESANIELARTNRELIQMQQELLEHEKVIMESEERYHALFDQSPAGVLLFDRNLICTDCNDQLGKIMGSSRETIIGTDLKILKERTTIPAMEKAIRGMVSSYEGPYQATLSESFIYISCTASPIHDAGGTIIGGMGVIQDITDRMRAEEALKKSEERYRLLVENAGEAIVVAQGIVLRYANPMASALTGFTREELSARPFIEFIHPDDRTMVAKRYTGRLAGEDSPPVYEFRLVHKDGGYRWVEINVVAFAWEKIPATLNFFKDITARKLAEEKLKESEERFRTLIESAPIGIGISRNTEIVYVNRAFIEMFGVQTMDHIIGRPLSDLAAPQAADDFMARARKREEGADVENIYESIAQRMDGTRFAATVAAARVNLPDGPATIAFFQDITRHKNTEADLGQLVTEKEILLKELQHRIKNNLNVVSNLLGLELENLTDEPSRQVFINAQSRINSIAMIYEQLNRSSHLDSVNLGLYIMDLAELTFKTYALDFNSLHLETRVVDVELDIKRAVPLGIILNELVSNGVKNTYRPGTKGEIRIDLENIDGRITLRVSDDGPGFPAGFNPETTDTLGLKLVSTLAKQIDAAMTIENKKGAIITLAFQL